MRAERYGWPCPARRCLAHDGCMAHGGKLAEARCRILKAIAHDLKARIGTLEPVDASEPANPVAGLRQGNSHMPASAPLGAARECRHDTEGHQEAGSVVECLRGERLGLVGAGCLRFGVIEPARRLHQRIEAAPPGPWTLVAVSAERDVDNAGPHARHILRAEAKRG